MSEIINLDAVTAGLKSIASLRSGVSDLFKCLNEGVGGPSQEPGQSSDPVEEAEKQFLSNVQVLFDIISSKMRELETSSDLLNHQSASASLNLGMLGRLAQDPALENSGLYPSIVSTFRWFDRMHDYVTQTSHILGGQVCKRNGLALDPLQRMKSTHNRRSSIHNIDAPTIDNFFNNLSRILPNVNISIERPFGSPTILRITLDKILKGILVLNGMTMEYVIVKGISEEFKTETGTLDIWSESQFDVFKKVSEHCNSAILHFASPFHLELAVRSWLNWFISFQTLFNKPCRACGQRLSGSSLPTWRDFRNGDAFHEKCRP